MRFVLLVGGLLLGSVASLAQVTVDFVADRTEGCGIFQVNFTDQSSSSAGSIVAWEWNLGGQISNVQHPGRIFNEPGVYDICLTVTDDQGNSAAMCMNGMIEVYALPVVDFSADPVAGCAPLEVTFTDLSQSANGGIVERIWGIGGTAGVVIGGNQVATVTNQYIVPDLYSPSLTVRDEKGCLNTRTVDDLIRVGGIEPFSITQSDSFACTAPLDVTFTLASPVSGLVYSWQFGNGDTFTGTFPPPVSYVSNGVYDVEVIAYDPMTECRDTMLITQAVTVGLEMFPEADTYDICLGTPVNFKDSVDTPGATYLWEFGDGMTSTDPETQHTYAAPGCYSARLTKFYNGCSRTVALIQCIQIVDQPIVQLTPDQTASCVVPTSFTLQASSPTSPSFEWRVGNNGPVSGPSITVPSDTFGLIPVLLTARASAGCVAEVRDTLYVGDLNVQIPGIATLGCVPYSASLQGSVVDGFDIVAWDWTILTSPPMQLSGQNPSFSLNEAGRF
ncbi:MAG: PKD domain-containing protein, partial [Saprospiraceae bacterium]|nr:PKD domain-containing protein [Saprospiraceae bacterium]